MWEWRLGVQPRELAVPRRQVTTIGVLLAAVAAGTVRLLAGEWIPATLLGFAVGGLVVGYAEWRWTRWIRGRYGWFQVSFPLCFGIAMALFALGDRREQPGVAALWAGMSFAYLCLTAAAVRALRTHPARPGWYRDPAARADWRWWDGATWAERIGGPVGEVLVDPDGAPDTTLANAPRRSDPAPVEPGHQPDGGGRIARGL